MPSQTKTIEWIELYNAQIKNKKPTLPKKTPNKTKNKPIKQTTNKNNNEQTKQTNKTPQTPKIKIKKPTKIVGNHGRYQE